jgi:hypothetical protein
VNIPLSLPQYFSIGFALIVSGRVIQYLAVTRYLKERGVVTARAGSLIPDWKELNAYRQTRLSDHQPLIWWYVLWTIQVILCFWVVGWIANGVGSFRIGAPSHFTRVTNDAGNYATVFDVTQSGYRQWSFAAFGLIFVAVGLALPTLIRIGIFRKPPAWMQKWFPRFFLGFAIIWTLTSFAATYADYRAAVNAMRSDRAQVIEGVITDFRPMPYTGHAMESFVVRGVRFEYSDYVITAGFNNTSSHGGPIREGLPVKIWHRGNEILRLDIATRPNQAMQPTTGRRTAKLLMTTTSHPATTRALASGG